MKTKKPINSAPARTTKPRLNEYEFTLILTGVDEITSKLEDALYEAGCDDATMCLRVGRVHLLFARTAASYRQAVLTAIKNVRRANVGADVLCVDGGNLVSQSDIARRMGRSRQLIHQYITGQRGPGSFPTPTCFISEGCPLWSWRDVATWLWKGGFANKELMLKATDLESINVLLQRRQQRRTPTALE